MTGGADFWSRRKAQVAAEEVAEARASEAEALVAREAEQAEKTDVEMCEELGLPDPDTLGAGDDFSAFMAKAVPERLRRRALRRLWLSNPALANLDGMLEYGEDFTDRACVIEGMQTAYQVGKGMLAHVQEMARQAEVEANAAETVGDDVAEPAPVAMTGAMTVAMTEVEQVAEAEPNPEPAPEPAPQETACGEVCGEVQDDTPQPPRRRMRFAFADTTGEMA